MALYTNVIVIYALLPAGVIPNYKHNFTINLIINVPDLQYIGLC